MYSQKEEIFELLGTQEVSVIENETAADYENRMVYVCKDICQDFVNTELFKKQKSAIKNIKVILTNPWCVYEIMDLEKKLDKPEKINQKLIDQLIVHKEVENVSILKNSIINISLNGYNVQQVNNQVAEMIHVQYLSIYGSTNFLSRLKNTLDTIFHLHDIEIDSVYSHINENHRDEKRSENELRIIIEDQGLDLSYTYQNKNVATLFIKSGYLAIKDKIRESLHIDKSILEKILKSKSLNLNQSSTVTTEKNLTNIWLDLDEMTRKKIDDTLNSELAAIHKEIRNFIDNIDKELIKKDVNINIYCLDETIAFTIGYILGDSIKSDAYIIDTLLTNEGNIFTKKIF